ncbi:MAG TPA: hypothetical protein VGO40_13420 [Longimicrobium sp.]|nr:hypothetical protein [Longimicrobium sp.]
MRYLLYGLSVHSDVPLPGLRPDPAPAAPDVRLSFGAHPVELACGSTDPWYVAERDGAGEEPALTVHRGGDGAWLRLRYADGTEFTLDAAATRVGCTWPAALALEDALTYLLGPVCGVLLRLRGVTCLHASVVSPGGGGAVLLCGAAEAGKSTTAAALAARGARVLADDVAALEEVGGALRVRPAYPHLRLWPDAVRALYGEAAELPPLTPNWEKRYLDLGAPGGAWHDAPLPVDAVYLLADREPGSAPRLEALAPSRGVLALVANTYAGWLPGLGARGRDLALYGRLVREVPVLRAVPHEDAARLPELCALLEADADRRAGRRGG